MARIAGVNIPRSKVIQLSRLLPIYGIGLACANDICGGRVG